MPDIRIKRGMPLSLNVTFANADGTAFDLSAVTLGGSVRDARDAFVAPLAPVASSIAGAGSVLIKDTSSWPEGLLRADITVQATDGTVAISDQVAIRVERAVTQIGPAEAPYDPVGPAGSPAPGADPSVPVG